MQYIPMDQPKTAVDPYLKQKIFSASPEQLIAYVYDVAIKACHQENKTLALEAVQELINALNYEHKELAFQFYRVYERIQNLLRRDQFHLAKRQLSELRDTWKEAFQLR